MRSETVAKAWYSSTKTMPTAKASHRESHRFPSICSGAAYSGEPTPAVCCMAAAEPAADDTVVGLARVLLWRFAAEAVVPVAAPTYVGTPGAVGVFGAETVAKLFSSCVSASAASASVSPSASATVTVVTVAVVGEAVSDPPRSSPASVGISWTLLCLVIDPGVGAFDSAVVRSSSSLSVSSAALDSPKSPTHVCIDAGSTKMFAGLMSRCTIPFSCRKASAVSTSSRIVRFRCRSSICERVNAAAAAAGPRAVRSSRSGVAGGVTLALSG
mmetsp:Transcript_6667/g.20932  ORF Transcript_6667/g.20932 Transcript_6667/m.20932 type:complete len:271 (+) Transcript_6667:374-1186(+)